MARTAISDARNDAILDICHVLVTCFSLDICPLFLARRLAVEDLRASIARPALVAGRSARGEIRALDEGGERPALVCAGGVGAGAALYFVVAPNEPSLFCVKPDARRAPTGLRHPSSFGQISAPELDHTDAR